MKYRKLRIAWSVGWGIAAVMLTAVSTYSCKYTSIFLFAQSPNFITSKGELFYDTQYAWDGRCKKTEKTIQLSRDRKMIVQNFIPRGLGVEIFKYRTHLYFWPAIPIFALASAMPWCRYLKSSFSLRTLLIAMTLVAVVLGLIVWAVRN